MLDKARARNVYDELAEDELMSWLAAHPQPADQIAATDVLIYVGKLDSMFAEVARHLPSQGVFAFSTESPPGLADDYRLVSGGRYSHSVAYIELPFDQGSTPLQQYYQTVNGRRWVFGPTFAYVPACVNDGVHVNSPVVGFTTLPGGRLLPLHASTSTSGSLATGVTTSRSFSATV